jgi:hypothetical protein
MYRARTTLAEPFAADRQLAEVLREANELRRSRSLPEWHPVTTTLGAVVPPRTRRERIR